MFKKINWKNVIYALLAALFGLGGGELHNQLRADDQSDGQLFAATINAPVFTEEGGDQATKKLWEVWCNCQKTLSKETNVGGRETQPIVPYSDDVSSFKIIKYWTSLPSGQITELVGNKEKFCGENAKVTSIERRWQLGQ